MVRPVITYLLLLLFLISCKRKEIKHSDVVVEAKDMDLRVAENIPSILSFAEDNGRRSTDSTVLNYFPVIKRWYEENEFIPLWSSHEKWNNFTDSFLLFLSSAKTSGLYPDDYNYNRLLASVKKLREDSVIQKDAVAWAQADLALTNSFSSVINDLKRGRLYPDSVSWKYDTAMQRRFFSANIVKLKSGMSFTSLIEAVQPQHEGYKLLKAAIAGFADSLDDTKYTFINFPYTDTIAFFKTLRKRLSESGTTLRADADSNELHAVIRSCQVKLGLKADGKPSGEFVKKLNDNDAVRFKRIAITLDRYKQLPEKMPEKYIWVNLPSFYLQVYENDTLALLSKIICGKPGTPTPLLNAAISDIIIFPTWTVPSSIISKDMLPALKRNSNYLARKGLYLLNNSGERIDPSTVNWAKYSKGIPYRIQQGSGDDNALGVIKFNFNNPFSVYLHDTNQRYLFKNTMRSLSHGCVRVQEWESLARIIIRNDSLNLKQGDTLGYSADSIATWIANKEMHRINIRNRYPLFIEYFGCAAAEGQIKFYDDIYGHDKVMMQKYFAGK